MRDHPWLGPILRDERLTANLGDEEARVLVEWLVERAELLADDGDQRPRERELHSLCRRGRGIARFVSLWSEDRSRGAACQLAASEGFRWPLPATAVDPCELMQSIVRWEDDQIEAGSL